MALKVVTAESLRPDLGFNWIFLIELLVCGILSLFFLFYFNRLFAALISYAIRAYTWHKYRVYIDFKALQISLLGGRIFFKGFRYHGHNETIFIHGGYITWRYWLRRVKSIDGASQHLGSLFQDAQTESLDLNSEGVGTSRRNFGGGEKVHSEGTNNLPCRIDVTLQGLEWFVYNRSAAFDAIATGARTPAASNSSSTEALGNDKDASVQRPATASHPATSVSDKSRSDQPSSLDPGLRQRVSNQNGDLGLDSSRNKASNRTETYSDAGSDSTSADDNLTSSAALLRYLPVHISCTKGAMVMGNEHTKSIFTLTFEKANGDIDAEPAHALDEYRQLFKFDFVHPVVQFKPNLEFKESQISTGNTLNQERVNVQPSPSAKKSKSMIRRASELASRWTERLSRLFPSAKHLGLSRNRDDSRHALPTNADGTSTPRWKGLARYLDESMQEEHDLWDSVEYARYSTVADSPSVGMSLYWDVPGRVPQPSRRPVSNDKPLHEDINGDPSPGWGLDLRFNGGTINYGPWTDRQRADLQSVFFPNAYQDAVPADTLSPGQSRVATKFKVFIELEDDVTLRIPTREHSKDWKWKRKTEATTFGKGKPIKKSIKSTKNSKNVPSSDVRPFGWFDVKISTPSSITYSMDMVAGSQGFKNSIDLDLRGTMLTSSVNHGLCWKSGPLTICCDLSNPLRWNALRTWHFDIAGAEPELFLLRDHIFLLTDMIQDWASGPAADYYTYTPFVYRVDVNLSNFNLYFNVNDNNIINNPADLDDNAYLIIWGAQLHAEVNIPLENFRPSQNEISFDVDAKKGGMKLHCPPWNTQASFLESEKVALLKDLDVRGSYNYFASTSPALTDTLTLHIFGQSPTVDIYGFLVRYFLKIKDNYFGEHIHFKTLDEFRSPGGAKSDPGGHDLTSQRPKKTNDLDVILSVEAANVSAGLPANLYSANRALRLDFEKLMMDMRFTSYYMDLSVSFSPLTLYVNSDGRDSDSPAGSIAGAECFVDGVSIYGHRLFGLPPSEPTYVCNWDFQVGAITGECSTQFLKTALSGFQNFAFTFDDDENALPSAKAAVLYDVTFLRARIASIRLWVHVGETALLLGTDQIRVDFTDWARDEYSERLTVSLPSLTLACINAESVSRHRFRAGDAVETHALLETSVQLAMIQRKAGFQEHHRLQQQHVKYQDQRTHRTAFLQTSLGIGNNRTQLTPQADVDAPALPFPPMPQPLPRRKDPKRTNTAAVSASIARPKGLTNNRTDSFRSFDQSTLETDGARSFGSRSRNRIPRSSAEPRVSTQTAIDGSDSITNVDGVQQSGADSATWPSKERGNASSTMAFSSSFISPYFPLQAVTPDFGDVPAFPESAPKDAQGLFMTDLPQMNAIEDDVVSTSCIISVSPGIRALARPDALHSIVSLLRELQPRDPQDLLDDFQVEVMGKVFDVVKSQSRIGKVLDICLRIPSFHFRYSNCWTDASHKSAKSGEDNYNLSISNAKMTSRSVSRAAADDTEGGGTQQSIVHISIDSANVSITEKTQRAEGTLTAMRVDVDKVVFWSHSNASSTARLQCQSINTATEGRNISYLAALIHRTTTQAEELSHSFAAITEQQERRRRVLIFGLVSSTGDIPDPTFSTRPAYVLRSAEDHIRLTDSWKVVSRTQHIYHSVSESRRDELRFQSLSDSGSLPQDSEARIIDSLTEWLGGDLVHVKKSYFMQSLYRPLGEASAAHGKGSVPLRASANIGSVRFLMDPGPRQSEISLADLSVGLAMNVPDLAAGGLPIAISSSARTTAIHLHSTDVKVRLNWELLDLVEELKNMYENDKPMFKETAKSDGLARAKHDEHFIHVVVATETGAVTIDGINLRCVSVSKGLKGSLVMSDRNKDERSLLVTLLLNADAASSELIHGSRILTMSRVHYPSIYVSLTRQFLSGMPVNIWKVAATSRSLSYALVEEMLGLIEAFDSLLTNEIAHVHRLASRHGDKVDTASGNKRSDELTTNRFSIALFLESYSIELALLQSIRYTISGSVARTSVSPRKENVMAVDFDLKEQQHEIQADGESGLQTLSTVQLPPVNGRVIGYMGEEEKRLEVFASVESIAIDAAAIHRVSTVLNRPDVSRAIRDIQTDATSVGRRVENELRSSSHNDPVPERLQKPSSLIFDSHITIGGLGIYAIAPGAEVDDSSVKVELSFNGARVRATNRLERSGPPLEFLEVEVGLRDISFELSRMNGRVSQTCGNVKFGASLSCSSQANENGDLIRSYHAKSVALQVNILAETASGVVDIIGYLQDRIKEPAYTREAKYLQKLRRTAPHGGDTGEAKKDGQVESAGHPSNLFGAMYSLEMANIQAVWVVGEEKSASSKPREPENLVLSITKIDLSTRRENSARLMIENFQLQMVRASADKRSRSLNSALLPEVVFNVAYLSTSQDRRLAFQAAGKSLDLRLTTDFILPANDLQRSIANATDQVRSVAATWDALPKREGDGRNTLLGNKRLASLLVDADFAGAVVDVQGKNAADVPDSYSGASRRARMPQHGRYGQFTHEDSGSSTALRAPGVAVKVEYRDDGKHDPSLMGEVRVDASTNILYPTVVPLILEISSSVKAAVGDSPAPKDDSATATTSRDEETILTTDPTAILGRCRLNVGLRICRQEFSLSCQPIARVAATAKFEEIYITVNTVHSREHGHFFAMSAAFSELQISVQHVYSRESTGNFYIASIVLSLMNSKHLSGIGGLSAILKISPTRAQINARQFQDFLLFREIWVPREIRQSMPPKTAPTSPTPMPEAQSFLVQQYQQVASASAFPWNATVAISSVDIQLDLGQSLGKLSFEITRFWVSSKKNSDWEQNLCLGFDKASINGTGRMNGLVELQQFKIRTSIQWLGHQQALHETPLIQASVGFGDLRVKAAFDFQPFLVAHATAFEFLMYNVRDKESRGPDRLVGILDGDSIRAFCTANSASQSVGLYQAVIRLVQEKRSAYQSSLKEIESFLRRKSTLSPDDLPRRESGAPTPSDDEKEDGDEDEDDEDAKAPISLQTDVVITLREVDLAAYPSTFLDNQVFKVQALNAQARFAATVDHGQTHSGLGLRLGQLRVALSPIYRATAPDRTAELVIDDVIGDVMGSRGGTILKVPRLVATMQTWQVPLSRKIDYIFKSSFEGKVDVGWNYSRISFIRDMWNNHNRNLGRRLGKPISQSTVKITGGPQSEAQGGDEAGSADRTLGKDDKITAVVNVPQSKYEYNALKPAIIETPQLRDMGEATPPLEWIGLHRDRLPNLTHQIVIVSLLELAREVEDAYGRILGTS
ncbi:MAG: hypothetical protein M1825_005598 [Sarcosagium campestre]|nr:MAG: hypothetical protein M1825_005598 [Sarcosagium campestre]